MIEIPLTRGTGANRTVVATALIDDADAHLAELPWRRVFRGRQREIQYAVLARRGTLYLHRAVMGAAPGDLIDHRDGDGLNCQRGNLRLATRQGNGRNRSKGNSNSAIPCPGVSWRRDRSAYRVTIDGRYVLLTKCLRTAILARVEAEREHWGEVGCWYSPGLEDRLAACQT